MKENKQIFCLPPLSINYPWSHKTEEDDAQANIFNNLHDPMSHNPLEIPVLLGKRIRGCFYGCWTLLSSKDPQDVMWSLWNPVTSKMIHLPPMINQQGSKEGIEFCCLSAPPDHPNSLLLLTRTKKLNLVFCRLGKLRWTEISYAKQVRSIFGFSGRLINLTCCNGKVYANIGSNNNTPFNGDLTVEVNIVVNDRKKNKLRRVVITLLPVSFLPYPTSLNCRALRLVLKGSCTQLFTIFIGFIDETYDVVGSVNLFKLDMNNKTWEEVEDLKDTILFEDLSSNSSFFNIHAISSSELGGYIHFLCGSGKTIFSYHVNDKTISVSPMPECDRLQGEDKGDEIVVRSVNSDHEVEFNSKIDESLLVDFPFLVLKMIKDFCVCVECLKLLPVSCYGYRLKSYHTDSKQEVFNDDIIVRSVKGDEDESPLLNIPLHVLEMVMKYSVGVEYLKFRSTCKRCHLAAPLIKFNNGKRLQTYSLLISPCWLMVFDQRKGVITFTDPMFGDKYFINTPQQLICDSQIKCSRYGWLLIEIYDRSLKFFNPFTKDIRKLPVLPRSDMMCFSAPPTCPDCMVAILTEHNVFIHFVAREPTSWIALDFDGGDPNSYRFLTFYGQDLYATRADGRLDVFKEIGREDRFLERDVAKAPLSCCTSFPQTFQVRCDQHLLQVIVAGGLGESVEVFKLNESTKEWVKIDCLGKHMIYIYGTPICIDAKTPNMENKI